MQCLGNWPQMSLGIQNILGTPKMSKTSHLLVRVATAAKATLSHLLSWTCSLFIITFTSIYHQCHALAGPFTLLSPSDYPN